MSAIKFKLDESLIVAASALGAVLHICTRLQEQHFKKMQLSMESAAKADLMVTHISVMLQVLKLAGDTSQ